MALEGRHCAACAESARALVELCGFLLARVRVARVRVWMRARVCAHASREAWLGQLKKICAGALATGKGRRAPSLCLRTLSARFSFPTFSNSMHRFSYGAKPAT